jgi:hypothetical protein
MILFRLQYAVGKPRNRHAHVGRHRPAPRPQREGSEVHVVPRVPQPLAILQPRRPLEAPAPTLRGKRFDDLRLLGDVALGVAMELEQQRVGDRVRRLRVTVHRVHLHIVQQLDSGDRHAKLNRGNHCVDGALDRVECTHGCSDRLGNRIQPHGNLGDDAQRAFRADEQAREVVSGG